MRKGIIHTSILSCVLILAGCPNYTLDVPEDEMHEYALVVDKVFYLEDTREFRIKYHFENYSDGGMLYEDYDGSSPFSFIDYISNLDAYDFASASADVQFRAIYKKAADTLPATAFFDTRSFIYIYTEEEMGGGIPGIGNDEDWTATAKARIISQSAPITIVRSATFLVTPLSVQAHPDAAWELNGIAYADEDLILANASNDAYDYSTWAYYFDTGTWSKIFDHKTYVATSNPGVIYCRNDGAFYESVDKGITWTQKSIPALDDHYIDQFQTEGTLWCAVYDDNAGQQSLMVSTDSGSTWSEHIVSSHWISALTILQGKIFASRNGVQVSSDNGNNWTSFNIFPDSYAKFVNTGSTLYIEADDEIHRYSTGAFNAMALPTWYTGRDYHEAGGFFMYRFEADTGFCIEPDVGSVGSWRFLSKDARDVRAFRIIGDRIVFLKSDRVELYTINQ